MRIEQGLALTDFLNSWKEDQECRVILADDGTRRLQVRLMNGVLEYHLNGRPDGKMFKDFKTYFGKTRSEVGRRKELSDTQLTNLIEEAGIYYERSVHLWGIDEYDLILRDLAHTEAIIDYTKKTPKEFTSDEVMDSVYQLYFSWPDVIYDAAIAQAMKLTREKEFEKAKDVIAGARTRMEYICERHELQDPWEQITYLSEFYATLEQKMTPTVCETIVMMGKSMKDFAKNDDFENALFYKHHIDGLKQRHYPEPKAESKV